MGSPASKKAVDRLPKPKKPIPERLDELEGVVTALRTLVLAMHGRLLITERVLVDKFGVTQADLDAAAATIAKEQAQAEQERQGKLLAERMGVKTEANQVGSEETPLYVV